MGIYDNSFFERQKVGSLASARNILPFILNLIHPKSVINVGCGVGTWLSVCMEAGIEDVLGVDGNYVDRRMLLIPPSRFLAADLRKPLQVDREFDLVLSLEVIEHLPKECECIFIDTLVRLGKVVVFGGCAPVRGGVGHLNEQWQSHWVGLFRERGFETMDCIRPRIWDNREVAWWYAQDTFLFADTKWLDTHPHVRLLQSNNNSILDVIHPRLFEEVIDPHRMSLRKALAAITLGLPCRLIRKLKGDRQG